METFTPMHVGDMGWEILFEEKSLRGYERDSEGEREIFPKIRETCTLRATVNSQVGAPEPLSLLTISTSPSLIFTSASSLAPWTISVIER